MEIPSSRSAPPSSFPPFQIYSSQCSTVLLLMWKSRPLGLPLPSSFPLLQIYSSQRSTVLLLTWKSRPLGLPLPPPSLPSRSTHPSAQQCCYSCGNPVLSVCPSLPPSLSSRSTHPSARQCCYSRGNPVLSVCPSLPPSLSSRSTHPAIFTWTIYPSTNQIYLSLMKVSQLFINSADPLTPTTCPPAVSLDFVYFLQAHLYLVKVYHKALSNQD